MKHIISTLLFMAMALGATAQTLTPHRGVVSDAYNFWIYTPPEGGERRVERGEQADSPKPLIVFLHGQSLCGRNLDRVRRYGPLNALEMGMHIDAYILAPQNPGGAWKPAKINKLVDYAVEHLPVDTNRIYVIGMSLGGFGTLDFVGTYPDRIAAAMALCGGANLKSYCGLNRLPLWIVHGTADRAVGIKSSQKVVDAMAACDTSRRLIWTRLQGADHGRLARIFYLEQTYEWLFRHSLADSARAVNRDYDITMDGLGGHIYRAVRAGGNKVRIAPGKGHQPDPEPKKKEKTQAQPSEEDLIVQSFQNAADGSNGAEPQYHSIKKGDTLSAIARRYGTTVEALCRLNDISATTTLRIGRRLRVK